MRPTRDRRRAAVAFLVPAILAGALVAGCAKASAPASPPVYAVTGTVYTSPACPGPARIDSPCPDRPLAAATVRATRGTAVVATTVTDTDGHYRIALPAGRYDVTATDTAGLRSSATKSVAVPPDATVDLTVDSGMR